MSDSDVVLHKIDEGHLKIQCDSDIAKSIRDNYKFFAPGYKFHPLYRNPRKRYWDGKVSLFNMKTNLFPFGLLDDLTGFLDEQNVSYEYMFPTNNLKNYDIDDAFLETFYARIFRNSSYYPRDYQHEAIRQLLFNKKAVVEEATGCHIKGTGVLMYDGSIKIVEDIAVGDMLMGADGHKREVLSLIKGTDQLYKAIPTRGKEFIVNGDHILHLCYSNSGKPNDKRDNTSINIPVNEYNKQNITFKHRTKLIWNDKELVFDSKEKNNTKLLPYFVGQYLGNGDTYYFGITSGDDITEMIYEQISLYGLNKEDITINNQRGCKHYHIRTRYKYGKKQPILNDFLSLGLIFRNNDTRTKCGEKFIPSVFKYGTIKDRYELLAGLIDSDGHLANGTYYEVVSKSKKLVDDLVFIARSLGFFVSVSDKYVKYCNKTYYRCNIQGDIAKIPVRVERKKYKGASFSERQKNYKRHNVSGLTVEPYNEDRTFYGFRLSGDGLYMLDNFMITHNSGKSLVIYCLIMYLLTIKMRIVLVVPNIMLVEQMRQDFKDYGWADCDRFLTIMYMDHEPDIRCPVLISTYQSLVKRDDSFISRYNAVVVDEVHQAPANSIQAILGKLIYTEYRMGMTGTLPDHSDPEQVAKVYEIYGSIGPLVARKPASELMEEGYLSKLKIANLIIKYPEKACLRNRNRPYDEEMATIIESHDRMWIFNYILNRIPEDENTIILCYQIKHLDAIFEHIQKHFGNKFKIRKIHGAVASDERIEIKGIAENEAGVVIVATYGTMSVGVNIKRLHNVILGSSRKSKISILQTIGRGLRLHETKDWLCLFDIVDDMRWKKRTGKIGENHCWEQFMCRLGHYKNQKFEYTNKIIKLEDLNLLDNDFGM